MLFMVNIEEEIFGIRKPSIEKLEEFGFAFDNNIWQYSHKILNQFMLYVVYNKKFETKLIEIDSGDEYTLYKAETATGKFVGQIRQEVQNVLEKIKDYCCDKGCYQSITTNKLIEYIKSKYGDEPEFLWDKFPTASAIRRKDNKKWYAVLQLVNLQKLGIDKNQMQEIVVFRGSPDMVDNKNIFVGFHMNKKYWVSMILNENTDFELIKKCIDNSYILSANKEKK